MKKLIAISVMLALVAGAAFAETSVGGALELQWQALREVGSGDIGTSMGLGDTNMTLSVADDEGTAGGMLRYKLANATYDRDAIHNRAFIWWKPIEQLQLFLGKDGDGKFESFNQHRWGYHAGTKGVSPDHWWSGGFINGGWDNFGFAMSIYPIDMITVNLALGLPNAYSGAGAETWENVFKTGLYAQINVNLDFGGFILTYRGSGTQFGGYNNMGDGLNFTFHSGGLVDGLNFAVGFTYADLQDNTGGVNQIGIGLAVGYSGGDWGVKFRMFVEGFDTIKMPVIGLMPYYNFGFIEARLNIEINGISAASGAADPTFVINPYIIKNAGPVGIRLGFSYDTAGSGTWSLPIGVSVGF